MLPQQSISTAEYAAKRRKLVNQGGDPFDYDPNVTPYAEGISNACDHVDVRVVGVKGPSRAGKTVAFENNCLKDWTYGPLKNVLWLMQDEDSVNDYIDERGDEMLRIHPEVNARIDWSDRLNGRKRKKIGRSLLLYRVATQRALRAKAAPKIVADEIDAYNKSVRGAIMTLITARQQEFGTASKAMLASHPDAGPSEGIDAVIRSGTMHLWWTRCRTCDGPMCSAAEAEDTGMRMHWNVPSLMRLAEEMDREDFLIMVADRVRLVCPHEDCAATYDDDQRKAVMKHGVWLQSHQRLLPDGSIVGAPKVTRTMGFVIHAFMAPFFEMRPTASDWADGKLTAQNGSDTHLREVTVKKLGETFDGAKPEEVMEGWKVVQARLAAPYAMGFVPHGCEFLTCFVDIQGDRFEVRVIGWSRTAESWLIDAFAIRQPPAGWKGRGAFENIDPGNRLSDFEIIEEAVLKRLYPLASNPERLARGKEELFLPIARTHVDAAGVPGAYNNAITWMADLLANKRFEKWQVQLTQGSAKDAPRNAPKATARKHVEDEVGLYGKPRPVTTDDAGKPLQTQVYIRMPKVIEIKKIIARRMKIDSPGPGAMHLPANISRKYAQELVAEKYENGRWVQYGTNNETWDGWVSGEVARENLKPDRPGTWDGVLPIWATLRPKGSALNRANGETAAMFERLARLNASAG